MGPDVPAAIIADMDALSSSKSGVNGLGTRIASSSAKWMALRVRLDTLRVGSSSAGSVGESMVERRRVSLKSEPLRNSPLVGVCDDEDGEEEEEENKMAAWMGVSLQRGLGVRRESEIEWREMVAVWHRGRV